MPLEFKGLSDDKTKIIFADIPTVKLDDELPVVHVSLAPVNAIITINTWAKTCQQIAALEQLEKPAKPRREHGVDRKDYGDICKAYRTQCEAIEAVNETIKERKGTEFIDRLMGGFALYEGLRYYEYYVKGFIMPDTPGTQYFKSELAAAALEGNRLVTPHSPNKKTKAQPAIALTA